MPTVRTATVSLDDGRQFTVDEITGYGLQVRAAGGAFEFTVPGDDEPSLISIRRIRTTTTYVDQDHAASSHSKP